MIGRWSGGGGGMGGGCYQPKFFVFLLGAGKLSFFYTMEPPNYLLSKWIRISTEDDKGPLI